MARNETTNGGTAENGFRISAGPVIRQGLADLQLPSELLELQRAGGPPLLFAIPRDPQTIFAYWNIDWETIFAKGAPVDRQVFLRVRKSDGTEESETVIEPLMGSHYINVATPGGQYLTEVGFYGAGSGWSAVATSEMVEMPRDGVSANAELDLATVPFHLSFQRMIDIFRASNGNALGAILSRLQARAEGDLTNEDDEVLRAMDISAADLTSASKSFEDEDDALRRKTEAVLGFGATSPAKGFGDNSSSWGAAGSSSSP
jgi:hypothetical protein